MITGKDLVEKLYSEVEENNLFQEIYEKAFSEGYEYAQKEFAKKDYEGLTTEQAEKLRAERNRIAGELAKGRKEGNNIKVPKENFQTARNYAYENYLKDARSAAGKAKENILKEAAEQVTSSPKVEEAVEEVVENTAKKPGVFRRAIKWANKNKKPLAVAGTTLASLGTAAGIVMSGNKKEDKK